MFWGGLAALLFLLALGFFLLPRFLSQRLLGVISAELDMAVEAEGVDLSWTGSQRIEDLRLAAPGGGAAGEEILRVRSARLQSGLLDLIFTREPLKLAIDEPVLHLRRSRDGRLNLEEIFQHLEREADHGETPSEAGGRKVRRKSSGKTSFWDRLRLAQRMQVRVSAGEVIYIDERLGLSSRLSCLDLQLGLAAGEVRLEGTTLVESDGACASTRGRMEVLARIQGLGAGPAALQIEGALKLDQADLRSLRGLLGEPLGALVAQAPLSSRIEVSTREGAIEASADLETGAIRVHRAACKLPLLAGAGPASLSLPLAIELAPALALCEDLRGFPRALELSGRLDGELGVSGAVSLDTLVAAADPLGDLSATLHARARGLEARWSGASAGTAGVELAEDELIIELRASTAGNIGEVMVERARLESSILRADLTGSARWSAGGLEFGEEGLRLELSGSLAAAAPNGESRAARLEVPDLEIAPGARLAIEGLQAVAHLGGEPRLEDALSAAARLVMRGKLAWRGVEVERLSGDLRLVGGRLSASGLEAAGSGGGRVEADELWVEIGPSHPRFRLAAAVDDLRARPEMAPLLAYVAPFLALEEGGGQLEGAIDARFELEGRGLFLEDLGRDLAGRGTLRIRDGRFAAPRLLREAGRLEGTPPEAHFAELSSEFEVGGGRIACRRISLSSREGALWPIGLEGTTAFDGSLDYEVDLGPQGGGRSVRLRGTLAAPELVGLGD
jgi:hypothetical protein